MKTLVVSDADSQRLEHIVNMKITRNEDTAQVIFDMLSDEDGNLKSEKGDYHTRQGVTKEPVLLKNVLSAQPLHGCMRSLDFYVKLATHLKAGLDPSSTTFWSKSRSRNDYSLIKQAKKEIQLHLKQHCGIRLDLPDGIGTGGTTTTGNIARRLLNNDKNAPRDHFIDCVPEMYRKQFSSLLCRHAVILNVLNSKREVKQVDSYKQMCHDVYKDLLTWFPNAHVIPTVYKMLAHFWELVSMNDSHGLGAYAEEGLEGCNKFLRRYRVSLSRKCGKEENQYDCFRRLWDKSDPVCVKHRTDILPLCKNCSTKGHSTRYCSLMKESDDDIFTSFFV